MRYRTAFPHPITEIENTWIPLADGTRLAARIWMPEGADADPAPAVLEYLPYRKDDGTASADALRHPYFAGHGYAAVRVDIRGTGDSDGILCDEYLAQEQDDALEVIAWLAAQPWCSGAVGMIGYSWGGFNGLQVAARRPPALKAVISGCSTDDRYLDDCHYMGGCLLGSDMLKWASWMRGYNALPPDPRFVGDRWREMWLERLDKTPHYVEAWLSHPRRDAYWKQGSIAEDYGAVEAAVFLFGGWADAYTNAIPRMLEHLTCPRAGLIGPWAHGMPYNTAPGPAVGFLQECVAWWDRHLKGMPNEVDEWPLLRAWMQEPAPARTFYAVRPGRWIAEDRWPPMSIVPRDLVLSAGGALVPAARARDGVLRIVGDERCGEMQGVWCANGLADELPDEQSVDDRRSLLFDTPPLETRLELLGFPELTLELSADRWTAQIAARLCDVGPDGTSTLLSWGMLNLTHRESHEFPEPLELGRAYTVSFRLNALGQAVDAGHRLRLALSPTYWPSMWPPQHPAALTVYAGLASRLRLPVRMPQPVEIPVAPFGEPEAAMPLETFSPPVHERSRHVEHTGDRTVITDHELHEVHLVSTGTYEREANVDRWMIRETDPLSARVRCEREFSLARPGFDVRIVSASEMWAEERVFVITDSLEAFEEGDRVFSKHETLQVPRERL
jgi:hypothetical protein